MATLQEYEYIDGVERLKRYTKGGYHPVEIGQILHGRYEIIDKLGYGGWSIVWLACDLLEKQLVAVKVGRADSLLNEVKTLKALETAACPHTIPRVLHEFSIKGPNGSHPCYTTSPALCNLRQSSFSRLFRVEVARALAYQLITAVAYVHSCGVVHGDIHLRNLFLKAPPDFHQLSIQQFREKYGKPISYPIKRLDGQSLTTSVPSNAVVSLDMSISARDLLLPDAHLLLADFGESFAPGREPRRGEDCHTPVDFRPPEVVFEPSKPLSFSADIWTLATALWDILGMQPLFTSVFCSDAEVMCQIVDTLGPLPTQWHQNWEERQDFFTDQDTPKDGREVWPRLEKAFEERVQYFRRRDNHMGIFSNEESSAILNIMAKMLMLKPEDRCTIQQVLESDWIVKWVRPSLEHGSEVG